MAAINRLETAETARVFPPVYSVEEFDTVLLPDLSFQRDIAGVTSVATSYLLSCVTPQGISLNPYSQGDFYCALTERVYNSLFKAKNFYEGTEELVKGNRCYAESWSIEESLIKNAAKNGYLSVEELYDEHGIWELSGQLALAERKTGYLGMPLDELESNKEELLAKFFKENGYEDLKGIYFRDGQSFLDCFLAFKVKKGIQIVYGSPEEFSAFIKSQNHRKVDDDAVEIQQGIPQRFIIALVALGSVDHNALRGTL